MAKEPLNGHESLITTRDAAKILDCSMSHVRWLAKNGKLWSVKKGERALFLNVNDVTDYGRMQKAARKQPGYRGAVPAGFSPDT